MALAMRCPSVQAVRPASSQRPVPLSNMLKPRAVPRRNAVTVKALGSQEDKKVLKREEEPEEYWVSKGERKGANPLSDPLAIIGIVAIFLPFAILLIAVATGLVDVSVYR